MVQSFQLDRVDERLIAALASLPRVGMLQLARAVGVARNTAQARFDRLIEAGVITGFGPDLDLRRVGYTVSAFVSLEIAQGRAPGVEGHLVDIPEVVEAYMTTGPSDLLCRVVARDNDHLGQVLNRILEVPGITRTMTSLVLATRIAPPEAATCSMQNEVLDLLPHTQDDRTLGVIPSRYSPVRTEPDGRVTVELAGDHPGVTDAVYRARRDHLAALAAAWQPGEPVPVPDYTEEEHGVWRAVSTSLEDLHDQFACRAFLRGKDAIRLPVDRVPQLPEVTERLEPVAGFRYQPVAGLAPLRDFYGSFGRGVFWSTQYLRHPSVPLYTPEPDVIHEVIGHANQLAGPGYADLYRLVGAAVARTRDEEALRFLSHVFWYTMEFGVLREDGELRAFGAGILSSVGETSGFREAVLRPADLVAMGRADYDITRFQPVLYVWSSASELEDRLARFLESYDDATPATLLRKAG